MATEAILQRADQLFGLHSELMEGLEPHEAAALELAMAQHTIALLGEVADAPGVAPLVGELRQTFSQWAARAEAQRQARKGGLQ